MRNPKFACGGEIKYVKFSSMKNASLIAENVTIISPKGKWASVDFQELWHARELLFFLVWRDVKVRYKQTFLGIAWAILQPLLAMLIFTVFFGRLANIPSDGVPYPVFAFCGLLPWQLFAYSLSESANSLVTNKNLVTKVYFPRLVMPLSGVFAGMVDFFCSFTILIFIMAYYHMVPSLNVVFFPLFLVGAALSSLSVGIWLSALNVRYRDVRYTIPFLIQFWLYATPIAYPSSLIPEKWRFLIGLNPMAGVVEGFRWSLLGQSKAIDPLIFVSFGVVTVLFLTGVMYFRSVESTFADTI